MIFENEIVNLNILDVLYLDQGRVNVFNKGRNFGALSYRVSSDAKLSCGEEEIFATDGAVCFFPAGLDYYRTAKKDECIVVHFNLDSPAKRTIDMVFPKNSEKVKSLFFEIYDVWREKASGYKYRATAILYEIFAECYVGCSEKNQINEKIRAGFDYINENYRKTDVSVSIAAKRSFVSEVYFRKLFKAEMGISPRKYIIRLRIQNAATLINTGYYSLKEVADACGYTDYKYFSSEFKDVMGIKPSEYVYKF